VCFNRLSVYVYVKEVEQARYMVLHTVTVSSIGQSMPVFALAGYFFPYRRNDYI